MSKRFELRPPRPPAPQLWQRPDILAAARLCQSGTLVAVFSFALICFVFGLEQLGCRMFGVFLVWFFYDLCLYKCILVILFLDSCKISLKVPTSFLAFFQHFPSISHLTGSFQQDPHCIDQTLETMGQATPWLLRSSLL